VRLTKILANQSSFKPVIFNKDGLSLIVGVRTNPDFAIDDERSYNGVGKSLLVEIVHFCLGSNKNSAFQNQLPDWEFSLHFEIDGIPFVSSRATSKQNEIILNGKPYSIKAFNEYLGKLIFLMPDVGASGLSFRSLIPRFIRRDIKDYVDPRITGGDKDPHSVLLRNLFLLGLDIGLIERKYLLRKRQLEIQAFEKNFKKDPFIREYYTGNKDATLQARHLEEQISRLDADLLEFKVAEDFYDLEKSANDLNVCLRDLKNKKVVIENSLHNIEKSLEIKTDLSRERVLSLYNELIAAFREESLARLAEVESFHNRLLQNRTARLGQERIKLTNESNQISQKIIELNNDLDKKMSYLSDKRALDQYVSVSNQRSELLRMLHKLQDYQRLLQKSRDDLIHIRKDLADETIKTNQYLQDSQKERDKKISLFSELAKLFYPDAPAGITISNNQGENTVRFDFDVRIEADGSDGINSVKIFCYDLAVLLLESNHNMQFIWHDSRLFSDIDPRQRATLFKIASQFTSKVGKQYIASVNQDQLDSLKSQFDEVQFNGIFGGKNVVLELKDDGPESKLLGMQIDMHY
jgi:uncharacterized protein YydD (DUF2326 family)